MAEDLIFARPQRPSFSQQLWIMIKRNLLLKRHSPKLATAELVLPSFLLGLFFLLGSLTPMDRAWDYPDPVTNMQTIPIVYPVTAVLPVRAASAAATPDQTLNSDLMRMFLVGCSPDTPETREIMATAAEFWLAQQPEIGPVSVLSTKFYDDEWAMEDAYLDLSTVNMGIGVVFRDRKVSTLSYTLRYPGLYAGLLRTLPSHAEPYIATGSFCRPVADTKHDNSSSFSQPPRGYNCKAIDYANKGFVAMQNVLAAAYAKIRYNVTNGALTLSTKLMPLPPARADLTAGYFSAMTPTLMISNMLCIFIVFLVITLVTEKDNKHIASMEIMGLRLSVYYLSWIIIYTVIILTFALLALLIIKYMRVWPRSDIFLLLITCILFGWSMMVMSFCVAAFFRRPLIAGLVTYGLIQAFSLISLLELLISGMNDTGRWFMTILSPSAFFMSMQRIGGAEALGHGIGWGNGLDSGTAYPSNFSFGTALIMIPVDTIIYLILALYLERVLPSDGSPRERAWFFLSKSYWRRTINPPPSAGHHLHSQRPYSNDIERVPDEMHSRIALAIRGLRKVFTRRKGDMVAVDGFTYEMYEDEILAVLGHNGAGKTTLISMITGLLAPSAGTALVYGHDINHSDGREAARTMIGICPQHDVLFDKLTVREHIHFYARLKGFSEDQAKAEFKRIIDQIGMSSQSDVQADRLSGGQRRRLSIAIAVVGNPKILLLDEPTSGVDPYNRRFLWDIIRDMRVGRCIIITTQSMQEADVFADRKLIISHGKLRCAGTSLFLKNRFGRGYHLTMSVEREFDQRAIENFVLSQTPTAQKARAHAGEISFILPKSAITGFPALFNALDCNLRELKIKAYGVSLTTMEEIFLKLVDDGADGVPARSNTMVLDTNSEVQRRPFDRMLSTTGPFSRPAKGSVTKWEKFRALLKIRSLLLMRSRMVLVFGVAIPFGLVVMTGVITLLITNRLTQDDYRNELRLTDLTHDFHKTQTNFFFSNESHTNYDNLTEKLSVLGGPFSELVYANLLQITPHYLGYIFQKAADTNRSIDTATIVYNGSAIHSIPYAANMLLNAVFQLRTGTEEKFTVSSRPFPLRNYNQDYSKALIGDAAGGFVVFVAIGLASIPGVFGVDVCRDRTTKLRSQIRRTGCSTWLYWSSTFFMHMTQYAISFVIIIALLYAFGVTVITDAIGCFLVLFALHAPTMILFSYCLSFSFGRAETAAAAMPLPFALIGFVCFMGMQVINTSMEDEAVSLAIHGLLAFLLPIYGSFGGLYFMDKVGRQNAYAATDFGSNATYTGYFDWSSNIPIIFVAHIIHIPLFILLIIFVESKHLNQTFLEQLGLVNKKHRSSVMTPSSPASDIIELSNREDEDVVQERQLLREINPKMDTAHSIVIRSLWKIFAKKKSIMKVGTYGRIGRNKTPRSKTAAQNISLVLPKGEIFGLLGPNGAGKTTTLSMITGETTPTSGDIHVNGYDLHSQTASALKSMGSCPQTDTIWDHITVEEHLDFFATLGDLTPARSKESIKIFSEGLRISQHMKKKARDLSGGTKRKLTFIISMIGNPQVVLLDEPSTGMDPLSKRNLWDMITQSFGGERGAILTTHSMEEADVICSRIGIMVKGQLRCLGSSQHLKDKFGSGYILDVKLKLVHNIHSEEHKVMVERVKIEIGRAVPGAECEEEFYSRMVFSVPKERITALGKVFANLDKVKNNLDLEEYSFSQTTIEQVFLHFAKMQDEDQEVVDVTV